MSSRAADAYENILCTTGEEPEDFICDLVQRHDVEPYALTCRNGTVDGFTIFRGEEGNVVNIRLRRALPGSLQGKQPKARGDWCRERYTKVIGWVEKVSSEICPRAALSHYGPGVQYVFGLYRRGPRSGLLTASGPDGTILGVDVARAYTSVMAGLPRLPVFSKFDNLRNPSGEILPHAFYLVWVSTADPILFPQELDLVSGIVLLYTQERRIHFSLVAELVPHKTVGHSLGKVLNWLYEESGLDDADKKQDTTASESEARNLLRAAGFKFATTKPYHWHDVGCLAFKHTLKLPTAELKLFQ
jgi:hypothetical protein